jgi:hypothetical protein
MSARSTVAGLSSAHPGAFLRRVGPQGDGLQHCGLRFEESAGPRPAKSAATGETGARPMEGDVLWKTGPPSHPHPQFPTGLGKRPPSTHPRFPHLPQARRRLTIYLDSEGHRSRRAAPASYLRPMHRCNCRRRTNVVDIGQSIAGRVAPPLRPWPCPAACAPAPASPPRRSAPPDPGRWG